MSTDIFLQNQNTAIIPKGIVESKLKASPYQMDIIAILLAEIGKPTDNDSNLVYTLSAETFANIKEIKDIHEATRILRDYICGSLNKNDESMRHIGFELFIDNTAFKQLNWFEKIEYVNGIATFTLTPDIKEFLVNFKYNDPQKIYAKLRYILPMKSRYSKRIYLMCREFIGSGVRFCDNDWDLFKEKLQIPSSFNFYHIKTKVLEPAIKEINQLSDIDVSYTIVEEKQRGGSKPIAIKFEITKKKEFEEDTKQSASTTVLDDATIDSMSMEELKEQLKKLAKKP